MSMIQLGLTKQRLMQSNSWIARDDLLYHRAQETTREPSPMYFATLLGDRIPKTVLARESVTHAEKLIRNSKTGLFVTSISS